MAFKAPELKATPFGRTGGMGPRTMNLRTEGKPPPAKAPSGYRVEDRIGINAPAEVIWEVIHQIERWHEWNPLYPRAEGHVRIGETLTLTLALPGQAHQQIRPKVLEWVPNEQLHWQLSLLGGTIKTIRYIEIDALAEESCVVDSGEIFGGLMGPSFGKRIGRTLRRGLREMNEALKARAEGIWRAREG